MTQPARSNQPAKTVPARAQSAPEALGRAGTSLRAWVVLSAAHLVNDTMQSLLLALYPLLKGTFALSYVQIGLITLTYQISASLPQPWLGHYNDRTPTPMLLCLAFSLETIGLLSLATAGRYALALLAAVLIGLASSVFHPIASPIVREASAGRHGLAQSIFQIGGNAGAALGPLLAALLVVPYGLASLSWLCVPAIVAFGLCLRLAVVLSRRQSMAGVIVGQPPGPQVPRGIATRVLLVLLVLMFSKYIYLTGIGTYYTFYLIHRFALPTRSAQLYLSAFLLAIAGGTLLGGPIVDRMGAKVVIWSSILGVAPFTIALPYVSLAWACVLSVTTGLILASAFPAILVFAQDLLPHRVGLVAGVFFGVAFGFGGVGAACLGMVADHFGIVAAFKVCSYLPLLGVAALFLPTPTRGGTPARGTCA